MDWPNENSDNREGLNEPRTPCGCDPSKSDSLSESMLGGNANSTLTGYKQNGRLGRRQDKPNHWPAVLDPPWNNRLSTVEVNSAASKCGSVEVSRSIGRRNHIPWTHEEQPHREPEIIIEIATSS